MTQKTIINNLIEKAGSVTKLSELTDTDAPRIYEWRRELYGMNLHKLLDMCDKLKIQLKDLL